MLGCPAQKRAFPGQYGQGSGGEQAKKQRLKILVKTNRCLSHPQDLREIPEGQRLKVEREMTDHGVHWRDLRALNNKHEGFQGAVPIPHHLTEKLLLRNSLVNISGL